MSKVAILQLPTLPLSEARLDYYLKICKDKNARLVLLAEYVLNSFFKEMQSMPKNIIKRQSDEKKATLCELSKKYELTIIAPIVIFIKNEPVKGMAKFSNGCFKFTKQQILMPYPHWNEAKFFANNSTDMNFLTFKYENLKVGAIFGYEAHFDTVFLKLLSKKIDLLLVSTASTFDSNKRWQELLKMRAFTNNIYIIRANRIGSYKQKGSDTDDVWKFYGDSFVVSAFGEIVENLSCNEEMLIADIDKKDIINARNIWCFNQILNKK